MKERDRNPQPLPDGSTLVLSEDATRLWLIRPAGSGYTRALVDTRRGALVGLMADRNADGTLANFILADYAGADELAEYAGAAEPFENEADALQAL